MTYCPLMWREKYRPRFRARDTPEKAAARAAYLREHHPNRWKPEYGVAARAKPDFAEKRAIYNANRRAKRARLALHSAQAD